MKTSCHPNHSLTSLAFHTHTQTAIASYCILFRYSLRRHKQQDVGCQVPIRAVQLPSTADKPHVDPTGSRQDHTNIFKLHSLSGAHISPAVMSFAPLKAGERPPYRRYFFLFFYNGTSAGRLWRDCITDMIQVCWSSNRSRNQFSPNQPNTIHKFLLSKAKCTRPRRVDCLTL